MIRPRNDLTKTEDGMMADFADRNSMTKAEGYALASRLLLSLSEKVEFDPRSDDDLEHILDHLETKEGLDI